MLHFYMSQQKKATDIDNMVKIAQNQSSQRLNFGRAGIADGAAMVIRGRVLA